VAGVTTEGFEAATLEEIKSDIESDQRTLISPTINTTSASINGQNNGIIAQRLRIVWELAQAVYNAAFSDSATGYPLTLRAALTGTQREAASASTVTATYNVDPGTYAIGTLIASVDGTPTSRFANSEAVVNGGGSAANVDALATCEDTGEIRANAGTLTVIAQAVSGWNSVTNADDADLGAEEESDAALRLRREAELRAQGSTTVDAIYADLLTVDGVTNVSILENDTGTTDGDGVPGHSIECIVYGPASPTAANNQAVADQIWASKAAGIGTYGGVSKTVVDLMGISHTVNFTRPTALPVYVWVTVETDSTYDGDTAVQEAIADLVTNYDPGEVLHWTRVIAAVYTVAGVTNVSAYGQNTTGTPSGAQTDITPTVRQVVTIDTGDVTVTS
jgi:uncharacterized phage protein gp47/JayE